MNKDSAGNNINEMVQGCPCGLTGGCEKCNPFYWNNKIRATENTEEGFIPKKDKDNFYKKTLKTNLF